MLSAAKHLAAQRERCFAALSMTSDPRLLPILVGKTHYLDHRRYIAEITICHPKPNQQRKYSVASRVCATICKQTRCPFSPCPPSGMADRDNAACPVTWC